MRVLTCTERDNTSHTALRLPGRRSSLPPVSRATVTPTSPHPFWKCHYCPLASLVGCAGAGVRECEDAPSLADLTAPLCNTPGLRWQGHGFLFLLSSGNASVMAVNHSPEHLGMPAEDFNQICQSHHVSTSWNVCPGSGIHPGEGAANQQQLPPQRQLGHVWFIPPKKRSREEQASGMLGFWGKLECCGAGKRLRTS